MIKLKLPKIIFIIFSFFLLIPTFIFLPVPVFSQASSFPDATIHPQPVIRSGNTSYHDGVGARDPWVIRDGGTYYLYYDCTENLYNPSFESNLGTNGWDVWHATVSSSTEQKLSGDRSLKVITDGTAHAGAYTGKYYYQNNPIPANAASGVGMAVFPGETYIASAYVWADSNTTMDLVVQQFKNNPGHFGENRLGDNYNFKQTIKGNNAWQRVSVKFIADIHTAAITLSMASTNAQATTSFWDGVQLERVTPSTNSTSDFPGNKEYFNRPIEELTGWRTCVATSTDGVNFDKKGPVKVTGAKGDWENVERPGWTGTSFMYANVFPYQGKWYAYYWKGGGPKNFKDDSEAYLTLTTHLAAGDSSHPDRTGLAVADSPLGPFRRISQNGPVVDVVDPAALCNQNTRSKEAATGKIWGCDYLTVNSVPQFIDNKWVLFLAGETLYQKNTWGGTTGANPDGNSCMVYGITAGIATSNSPLGPWTPSDINPIFDPAESCAPGALEGPIYYKDRSGKHVLFLNGISGGNGRVEAVWTDNPLTKWSLNNRKTVISKQQGEQLPGGTSGINLPTMVETPDGNTLNLYFGFRQGVPSGGDGADLHSFLFHDIRLATLPLPLFTTTSLPTASPVPAQATLTGYSIAESAADLPADPSNRRVIQTTQPQINLTHNFPESAVRTTNTIFVRFFYSNGKTVDKQQSIIYNPPPTQSSVTFPSSSISVSSTTVSTGQSVNITVNATSSSGGTINNIEIYYASPETLIGKCNKSPCTRSWTPSSAGSFKIYADVYDSNNRKCSSNPYYGAYTTSDPTRWANCGAQVYTITVNSL